MNKHTKSKRIVSLICISMSLLLIFSGCSRSSSAPGATDKKVSVQAVVIKVSNAVMFVQTLEGSSFAHEYVSMPSSYVAEKKEPKEGMLLKITFDGLLMESYPAQFNKIYDVEVLSDEYYGDESIADWRELSFFETEPATEDITTSDPAQDEKDKETILGGIASFGVELFKKEAAAAGDKNVFVSPQSVATALGMTANGAAGETLSQMLSVLAGTDNLSAFNKYVNTSLTDKDGPDLFKNANSVWVESNGDDSKLKESFIDSIKKYYDAEINKVDLASSLDRINSWVNEKTDGMIPQILNEIDDNVVLLLINAIAFQAKWEKEYQDSQIDHDGEFYASNGKTQTVRMLKSKENIYLHDEDTTGFIKYYEGHRYAFAALLPSEGTSITDYIGGLTNEKLTALVKNAERGDDISVDAWLPAFSCEYENELSKSLKEMGMNLPFEAGCDLSEMFSSSGAYKVDKVIHKTYVKVDEKGTKAAAVTAVEVSKSAAPPASEIYEVHLDRPFVYMILDTRTGVPVFMGALLSVN